MRSFKPYQSWWSIVPDLIGLFSDPSFYSGPHVFFCPFSFPFIRLVISEFVVDFDVVATSFEAEFVVLDVYVFVVVVIVTLLLALSVL